MLPKASKHVVLQARRRQGVPCYIEKAPTKNGVPCRPAHLCITSTHVVLHGEGCVCDARDGCVRAGIPAAGSGPLRHGTPTKLCWGLGVSLADGSAGSRGAHGRIVPHARTAPPRGRSVPWPRSRYGVRVRLGCDGRRYTRPCVAFSVLHGESSTGQASPRTTIQRMCQPKEAVQP